MAGLQWSDAYLIGVPSIDADHQLLFALSNQLAEAREEGQVREVVGSILNVLAEYVFHHFRREEALMQAGGYPGLAEHRREHRQLVQQAMDFRHQWMGGRHQAADQLADFLTEWLSGHILSVDIRYRPWVEKVELPSGSSGAGFGGGIPDWDFLDWDDGLDEGNGPGH